MHPGDLTFVQPHYDAYVIHQDVDFDRMHQPDADFHYDAQYQVPHAPAHPEIPMHVEVPKPKPVVHDVPKPVVHDVPKPVEAPKPKPIVHDVPKPVVHDVPKPIDEHELQKSHSIS